MRSDSAREQTPPTHGAAARVPDAPVSPEKHLGLARSLVSRYTGRGIEYEELYAAACLGLVKAANGFDPSRGICFSTYAVPVVLGEIRQLFRGSSPVSVSRGLSALCARAQRESERFENEYGREPRLSELAALLGVSAEDAAQAVCAARRPVSLSSAAEDGSAALDVPVPSFEGEMIENLALRQAVERLPPADRSLIRERYVNGLTQQKTAERLGMTQVQVSRREKKILAALREMMDG